MAKRYEPKIIEPKWQAYWDENKTYVADLHTDKPKYIGMSMFNYPSGSGIHIGHAMNYTISDVMARYKRQQGFESYHPVGWDSFGLPAENYAIKAGVSPQQSMATIIPSYHKQYRAMGWSNDWTKEIATHEPEYYKWTQWIFSEMYRNGLAYQDSRLQWFCEKCQTVLANEQINSEGKCWRHEGDDDPIVMRRETKQWFFRVTEYANELLEATDGLSWTEAVKNMQKSWIGKSEGMIVTFDLTGLGADAHHMDVFTTAVETIFGVTFMVLAPEHPYVTQFGQSADNALEIDQYVQKASHKSDVDREADKDKTGVRIEGLKAINPINGAEVEVWVADYVMMGYGSGAIMGVPGEDQRDNEFATKYGIPVIFTTDRGEFTHYQNEIKHNKAAFTLANSSEYDGMDFETGLTAIVNKLTSNGKGQVKTQFKIRDWSVTRQRYWGAPTPIIYCDDCGPVLVPDDQLPVILPELDDFAPSGDGKSALGRATEWLKASCPKCGKDGKRETDTLDTYICSSWYMLRYMDPHNDQKPFAKELADKWAPVDFYNGGDHATAHLIYARFVTRFFYKIGMINHPEPFARMLYNGKVTAGDGAAFSKTLGNGPDPLEIIGSGYGADALRTYLMFAAPLELGSRWDVNGVPATYRFINRLWNLVQEFVEENRDASSEGTRDIYRVAHSAIKKVSDDLESQQYNTAIAAMMQCVNELYALKNAGSVLFGDAWRFALESVTQLVAPFAPHAAEELWHDLGHEDSVNVAHWPQFDASLVVTDTITYAVQVNGKVRGEVEVPADAGQDEVVTAARANQKVASYLTSDPKKTIFVKGKLVSFVV